MSGHVLVVGAGGIGCPALIGLDLADVGRITVVDPDVVERSNLPRQVLYDLEHLGQPKAVVAAARFPARTKGIHARLDDTNFASLTEDVQVIVDATDGARTKDWLNHAAVTSGIPLVHAAGLRAEARLLVVPPRGRPCLACLFGRLTEESGSCADLGVWNGVVGVIGFLAAEAAVRVLRGDLPPARYEVFDFDAKRTMSLEATVSDTCPVCAKRPTSLEPFPDAVACDAPVPITTSDVEADHVVDLREVRCPMNLLRARQVLGDTPVGRVLEFQLGAEGAATVPDGVRLLGHDVIHDEPMGAGRRLRVRVVELGEKDPGFDAVELEQYARQLVLPDLGPDGQLRLRTAEVGLQGTGPAAETAARYLTAAGVGTLWRLDRETLSATVGDVSWRPVATDGGVCIATEGEATPASPAVGALLADRVQRFIVNPSDQRPSLTLR